MKVHAKELIVSILIILLFYLIIKRNNVIILKPSKDQMDNVSYYADDINDIDMNFKNESINNNEEYLQTTEI